jgi:hypothetical protein
VQKSEHGLIRFAVYLQIVKAVPSRRKPITLEPDIGTGSRGPQKLRCAMTKQNAMTKLVNRVFEIEAS